MVQTQERPLDGLDRVPSVERARFTSHWLFRQVVFALIIGAVVLGTQIWIEERRENRENALAARVEERALLRDNLEFVRSVVMGQSRPETEVAEESEDFDGDGSIDPEFDLQRKPFAGIRLANQNLTRLDLSGADLADSDLSGADLARADLSGAVLRGANLSGAILSGAILFDSDLAGADLSSADLSGVVLISADLSGVDFSGANLNGADLDAADLSGVDLSTASLSGVHMPGVFWDPDSPPTWPPGWGPPTNAWSTRGG